MVINRIRRLRRVATLAALVLVPPATASRAHSPGMRIGEQPPEIVANDNRVPAGKLQDGVLSISMVAGAGTWYPEKDAGPGHEVYAFGESDATLSNPGPLLRVPAGTEIRATVRNVIPNETLTLYGLHDRPGSSEPLIIPPGGSRDVRFRVNSPGTYFYWGTTRGVRILRDRFGAESQLSGVIIADPPGRIPAEHVFVIGIEDGPGALPVERPLRAAAINGRSWPHSAITDLMVGDTVRMRLINITDRAHPMHLHGFYFTVHSHGDITQDTVYETGQGRLAVTELIQPGQSVSLSWVPERPGNWLLHCHMTEHMSPRLRGRSVAVNGREHNHALDAMAGLVTGWRVRARGPDATAVPNAAPPRRIRLLIEEAPGRYGTDPGMGFVLQEDGLPMRIDSLLVPGPPIVLQRGDPVQITVVNHLSEASSVHWHGIELDSYFDGVSGWSGDDDQPAPAIQPNDSFTVRFTPPRAGTFIYHSHFEEEKQLSSGLYGPLLVMERGVSYNPDLDRTWVLSQDGPSKELRVMLNGSRAPGLEFRAGRRYRIRLININPNLPVTFSVLSGATPITWRALAKDGANLPPRQAVMQPAQLRIGVGETYDFEFYSESAAELAVRGVDPGGVVRFAGTLSVK